LLNSCASSTNNSESLDESNQNASDTTEDNTSQDVSNGNKIKVSFKGSEGGFVTGAVTQNLKAGELTASVTASPSLCYKFKKWSDGNTNPQRSNESFSENTELTAIFEYAGLPKIYVNYRDKLKHSTYINAEIRCENASGIYEFDTVEGQIKGRGNATWNHAKKPFVFKFNESVNLLGIGTQTSRDWVFLSNHGDQSLLRNYFAYNLAFEMGIGYRATQVEVYINGKYNGVYLVTGKVEESRLGVEVETKGGFIVERDYYYAGEENKDYFWVDKKPYTIKSDFLNSKQARYIKDCIKELDEAIASGNEGKIKEIADIDSIVNMYLLQEYTKNTDVGWSSFYIYKCDGNDKLHFGPAWDLDIAMGNDYRLDKGSYENIYVGRYTGFAQENEWFYELCQTEWFREIVLDRWNNVFKVKALKVLEDMRDYATLNFEALQKNFYRWDILGNRINCEPEQIVHLRSYDKHLVYLLSWLELRLGWLNTCFNTPDIWMKEIYDRTYPQYKDGKIPEIGYW
jgi:spore coat protein CotH